ncbi:MAG: PAS domain S-box protein [Bacteroidota bacterium]
MAEEKRILIFEPVPTDVEIIELQLRKAGVSHESRRAGTREAYLRAMEEFLPDLVIAEHGIPRCDVLALMKESIAARPGVRWIILSATGSEELAVECMKAGASEYIPKKNMSKLGGLVKAALEREIQPPPVPRVEEEEHEVLPAVDDLFRKIVENSHDLIAVLDREGRRLYNSPSYRDLLEEPDTLEGTSSFVDIHPEDRENVRKVFQETVTTGVGQRLEYRLVDREGNIRYIESQGSIISGPGGETEKVVIFSRDITARRHAGEIVRTIAEEIARLRGEEFFPGLVRALAQGLGVRYALVSECVDRRRERVRALAYWAAGGLAPVFEYDVKNTTCEQVVQQGRTMYFAADVRELFPEETALGAMNAYAYLGVPLLDSTATPIGHLFVIHDRPIPSEAIARSVMTITASRAASELEHRLTTRRLIEGENQYRGLLEQITDGVIVTDMEDVITYVNGRMTALTGHTPDEMLGKLASTLLIPDESRRDLYIRNERRRKGISERYVASLMRKDGVRFEALLSAGPHRNPAGEIIGTLALVTPRQGEAVPVATAEEPRAEAGLLEKAQDAVFVCDPEDRILFWNTAAARLYGWTADEARGKSSAELLHTEAIHRLGGAAHTALIEGYWAGELRQRTKDGASVLVDSRWTLVRDAEGRPKSLLVICTDITGKRELEIYELRLKRMEGITTLAAAIAADLDAMLTPVMLAIPTLAEKSDDDPSRQSVALVATNAQRGLDTAHQVLALAENAGGGRGLIDPGRLVSEVANSLTETFPESIRVEAVIPRGLWPIAGVTSQLQQVLGNVCTNAREAMSDGGILRLTAENLLIDAQTVASIPHALPGTYCLITIGDTGRGIRPEIIGKVFDPFFTTKPPGRTTGLGLSTAAAIVRNHKGFMNIYSEPGKGTIVKVYLPAGERGEGEEAFPVRLGRGEQVLVAQQQASLREIIKKILDAHGYDAITAADGAEAVALYRKHVEKIAAIVIDLDMPYMDGSMTIRVLQRTNPSVKIIATSGSISRDEVETFSILPKPFSTPDLLSALRRAVEA